MNRTMLLALGGLFFARSVLAQQPPPWPQPPPPGPPLFCRLICSKCGLVDARTCGRNRRCVRKPGDTQVCDADGGFSVIEGVCADIPDEIPEAD